MKSLVNGIKVVEPIESLSIDGKYPAQNAVRFRVLAALDSDDIVEYIQNLLGQGGRVARFSIPEDSKIFKRIKHRIVSMGNIKPRRIEIDLDADWSVAFDDDSELLILSRYDMDLGSIVGIAIDTVNWRLKGSHQEVIASGAYFFDELIDAPIDTRFSFMTA